MPLLPTSFLPQLGRPPPPGAEAASPFPIPAPDLLALISVLRDLYLPPIHGGLRPEDLQGESESDSDSDEQYAGGAGSSSYATPTVSGAATPMPAKSGRPGERKTGLPPSALGLEFEATSQLPPPGSRPIEILSPRILPTNGSHAEAEFDPIDEDVQSDNGSEPSLSDNEEDENAHLDPFERDWAEKWLNNLVRRSQNWLEAHEESSGSEDPGEERLAGVRETAAEVEKVQRGATACLAMMAGTSAAGSLTRHLLFPLHPSLVPALRTLRRTAPPRLDLSPETSNFLASLSISPSSPTASFLLRRQSSSTTDSRFTSSSSALPKARRKANDLSSASPSSSLTSQHSVSSVGRHRPRKTRRPGLPVLLHDAPMGDHLSVGVQTWGSAILLGREMARHPRRFGLSPTKHGPHSIDRGVRVLELGAGTGLLSILCRKILDLQDPTSMDSQKGAAAPGSLVVATDFLPSVLDNLKICLDLNFPSSPGAVPAPASSTTNEDPLRARQSGLHIAKLDWSTFPSYMQRLSSSSSTQLAPASTATAEEELAPFLADGPFDLVLASDCVYDPTHALMLREVVRWVLRLPAPPAVLGATSPSSTIPGMNRTAAGAAAAGDQGGTFHILSPLRPTFSPELESIDTHFPLLSTYSPLSERAAQRNGEGLGRDRGLRIGVRGQGKRGMRGKKGEGRTDEVQGYWWWEIGWG